MQFSRLEMAHIQFIESNKTELFLCLPVVWRLILLPLAWRPLVGLLNPAGGRTWTGLWMEGCWSCWPGWGCRLLCGPGYTGDTGLRWGGAGALGPPKRSAIRSRNESGSADLPLSDRCSAWRRSVGTSSARMASASAAASVTCRVKITEAHKGRNFPILWWVYSVQSFVWCLVFTEVFRPYHLLQVPPQIKRWPLIMSSFPQSPCEFPVCTGCLDAIPPCTGSVCLRRCPRTNWDVLRQNLVSLSSTRSAGSVRVLRPAVRSQARQNGCKHVTRRTASTGADTGTQNPESCSSREFLAGHGCETRK